MSHAEEVRSGLSALLPRLWRYGLTLSQRRDVAEDLVQATCVRALERAGQFEAGTRLDRWLFSILHSIWMNEVRARAVRQGKGFVDAETALVVDGAREIEAHAMAGQVLRRVEALPEAQRAAVFLAYVEGLSYREVADVLAIPIGTVMSRLAQARAKLSEATADRPPAGAPAVQRRQADLGGRGRGGPAGLETELPKGRADFETVPQQGASGSEDGLREGPSGPETGPQAGMPNETGTGR